MRLTRRYRFSASHRLYSNTLSNEKNREIYGKCANPYGHGHDYLLEVSVHGPLDERTGRIVDLDSLDGIVRDLILQPFEHANLNTDVEEFGTLVPTTENLALVVEKRLEREWPARFSDTKLDRIRIWETRRNIFEVRA